MSELMKLNPRERWLMIQAWRAAQDRRGTPMNQWLDEEALDAPHTGRVETVLAVTAPAALPTGGGVDIRGMEVFAVTRGWPYEGEDFVGVFRDLAAAKLAAEESAKVWRCAMHFICRTAMNEMKLEHEWEWRLLNGEWQQTTPTPEASR